MISPSRKLTIFIAFCIPLFLILTTMAAIQLPRYWAPAPQYSFVFATSDKYIYPSLLKIENNVLKSNSKNNNTYSPKLEDLVFYRYDFKTASIEKITTETALQYHYFNDKHAPDGYFIRCDCDGADNMLSLFLYYPAENKRQIYLQGHGISRDLNIPLSNKPYTYFKFIAWIKGPTS